MAQKRKSKWFQIGPLKLFNSGHGKRMTLYLGARKTPWSGTYKEYLKTAHWLATRKRILKRDGGRCKICNSDTRLEVHHRTYERIGNETEADLITLCSECHGLFHAHSRIVYPR